jgi:hypothetical protein
MRRITLISACTAAAGALLAVGFAAVAATGARAATSSGPSSVSLPITGYYQMAVDSADGRLFFSQGVNGSDSIVVTNFSGSVLGAIAEPTAVQGITLSPDGSTLYAALVGSSKVSPAISVISTASLAQTATYQLPAADTPQDVAVQSGKLWVSYGTGTYGKAAIGDFDLSAASPALEAQPAMGGWYSAPLLAADPTGAGNVLVAVLQNVLSPSAASYDTSADPVTVRAQGILGDCSGNEYDYAVDIAVVPGGAGFIPACDAPQEGDEYVHSTSDFRAQGSYATVGTPNAVAFASSTGLVAAGGAEVPQIVDVYTAGGVETNQYKPVGGGSMADRGLGLNAGGSELFAVTTVPTSTGSDYWLNTYPDPGITPTSVTLTQPPNTTVGKWVTITGTLTVGGDGPVNASIKVTRTGGGQPASTFAANVRAGSFTWVDSPPLPGTYTYTANYPATATSAASSASVKVTVAKVVPSFSLTVTPATASYGAAVNFDARFATGVQGNPAVSTVTVYAQTAGSNTKTKIASGLVGGSSSVTGTAHFDKRTTLYAVYPGNSDNAAVTVTRTVNVGAKVTAAIGGYYGTKSGYRLYHHTARVGLSAVVAPVKKGECVQFQVQEYVKKAWRAVMTTGCATLNGKSQANGSLSVSKYALGVPYRVRADFIRGKDTTNLDADSGFLSFMVEK